MNEIKKTTSGKNYIAATVGKLQEFEGKAFFKEIMGTTGMEISIGSLSTGQAVPFFHSHKKNEEVYIVISGSGAFQIDDDLVAIAPGSIVRVAPEGIRNIRCTSSEPLVYLCIQAETDSLSGYVATDAIVVEHQAKW